MMRAMPKAELFTLSDRWKLATTNIKESESVIGSATPRQPLLIDSWPRMMELRATVKVDNKADPRILEALDVLQGEVRVMRELLESHLNIQDEPDNYDMSVEDIKKLIAKECKLGQQYYPGDLAFEHGLNYDTVLEAVASLKEEGRAQS